MVNVKKKTLIQFPKTKIAEASFSDNKQQNDKVCIKKLVNFIQKMMTKNKLPKLL